jgi:hypothetical protein
MRFAIGDAIVEVIIDDDEFTLPLSQFLPGCDPELLEACRDTMTVKFQIAKQSGSKPIHVFMLALAAFNLGRYSEYFSGSGWAWSALVLNVLILCSLLFLIISEYRNNSSVKAPS